MGDRTKMKLSVEQEQAIGRLRNQLRQLSDILGAPIFDGVLDDNSDFEKIIAGVQDATNAANTLCKPLNKTHLKVQSGCCVFCGHYGDDCKGSRSTF